ncbi:CaiB/BaiF CoA transferase family protein [Salinirussus salinus]|jgi:crotonobetainyl-CoA:carnitine CoA-transferase CaiB-like acyl-CoA transferase|uniref:CaiB/BaiF CoA transferase family protein n=1 Tax=Salinirussus salinus TaxID=1198300 RepID=UPI0013588081|nr:CaiB/BaiF CoA-transferase family protein [Salinirussus salinus]
MPLTNATAEQLPLSDVTVVDLTQVIAGPFATMLLGDLGAEVVKIEAIGRGDRAREFSPYPEYFDTINRNKHSVALDLKSEEGQEVARTLLEDADVFVESMKPGRVENFGLSYEDVREINPEVVYCSISGFGRDSPYEDVPAWDMVVQAMSGIMSITGTEETPPLWSGLPSGDLAAATYTVQSVLAALYARETGQIEGEWVEVPMFDAAISWLCARAGYTWGTGEPFPRFGTYHPSAAPFGVFEAADGSLVIAASTDSLWEALCAELGREDLLTDERFDHRDRRVEHTDQLGDELEESLAEATVEEWVGRLHDAGVPAGPIHDTESVWEDDHVTQRGLKVTAERDERQDAQVIDHPIHFRNLATSLRVPPQELGESTDDVLAAHGYSDEEVERLREQGVVD